MAHRNHGGTGTRKAARARPSVEGPDGQGDRCAKSGHGHRRQPPPHERILGRLRTSCSLSCQRGFVTSRNAVTTAHVRGVTVRFGSEDRLSDYSPVSPGIRHWIEPFSIIAW
jgi:hypothetical protein